MTKSNFLSHLMMTCWNCGQTATEKLVCIIHARFHTLRQATKRRHEKTELKKIITRFTVCQSSILWSKIQVEEKTWIIVILDFCTKIDYFYTDTWAIGHWFKLWITYFWHENSTKAGNYQYHFQKLVFQTKHFLKDLLVKFTLQTSFSVHGILMTCFNRCKRGDSKPDFLPLSHQSLRRRTVFENHRKSLIQCCERSELRLHFECTKVQ